MVNSLRKSGLEIIGDVPWGTYICQFYHTKEDLTDILVPYFKAGLENNELCLWITSHPLEVEDALMALKMAIPNLNDYQEKGQIEIVSYRDRSFTGGISDPEKILKGWVEKLTFASNNVYEGLRLSGNASWLGKADWNNYLKYMEWSGKVIGNYKMIALCTYSPDKLKTADMVCLNQNYQFILVKNAEKWELNKNSKYKVAKETIINTAADWERIFDAVPDMIAIIDTNFKIVRVNRAMASKLGKTNEECVGLTCYQIVHRTTEPPSFCPHMQMLEDRFEHTSEVYEDGLGDYFIVSVSPFFDSEGRLTGSIHVARDISERKHMEEALRENEEKYRNIVETANEGIGIVNADFKVSYVNKKMKEMFGHSSEESIGSSIWDSMSEESKVIVRPSLEKNWHNLNGSFEIKHIRKDGSTMWAQVNAKSLYDKDGRFTSALGMLTDITERKEAEIKLKETLDNLEILVKERTIQLENAYSSLKESEKGLAEAQRMAHLGNWNWNLITGEMHWSDEMCRIFGRTPIKSSSSYNEVLSFTHPDDRTHVENAVKRALKGETFSIDHRLVLANGEERTIHAQGDVLYDEKNTPVRMIGTVQDITDQKKSEEKIRNLANIVESSNDAIGTISLKGTITSWNIGAEQVYGYSQEEILDKPISILAPVNLSEETKKFCERIKHGERLNNYETLRLRKDGKLVDVSITLSPIYDSYGKLTAVSFISRDITKRIETEKTLANFEAAREKEIHHRIKNNLQVVSSLLDLQAYKFFGRNDIKDSEVITAFRESENRVISMALIHEELYNGGGLDTINFSAYVEKLVDNVLSTYRFGDTCITLNKQLEENLFFNMDTAIPLGTIINEVISNSLKHAFPGRDKGEIQIEIHREENAEHIEGIYENEKGTTFALTISDNGVGITENLDIENLDSLGLQLVTSLVKQIDGDLDIKRNNGTHFIIRFTLQEKNNQTSTSAAPTIK